MSYDADGKQGECGDGDVSVTGVGSHVTCSCRGLHEKKEKAKRYHGHVIGPGDDDDERT